jgi:hypothetical protein
MRPRCWPSSLAEQLPPALRRARDGRGKVRLACEQDCPRRQRFLVPNQATTVLARDDSLFGNMPRDGAHLIWSREEADLLRAALPDEEIIRRDGFDFPHGLAIEQHAFKAHRGISSPCQGFEVGAAEILVLVLCSTALRTRQPIFIPAIADENGVIRIAASAETSHEQDTRCVCLTVVPGWRDCICNGRGTVLDQAARQRRSWRPSNLNWRYMGRLAALPERPSDATKWEGLACCWTTHADWGTQRAPQISTRTCAAQHSKTIRCRRK